MAITEQPLRSEELENGATSQPATDATEAQTEQTMINIEAAEAAEMPQEEEVAADLATIEATENETNIAQPAEPLTKEQIIQQLKELVEDDAKDISNDELSRLKQQFYQIRQDEQKREREGYLESGADPEAFTSELDPAEDTFKELITAAREKKAEQRRQLEATMLANLDRKRALITELNEIADDADNVNRHYNRAKDIQTEFLTIGAVPDTESTAVWKSYQEARERFYDQLKVNKELRDYDFKKNLADKQLLTLEAERLAAQEEDIIRAFRRLQELHEEWRRIGPVAKELREEIWNKFKDASSVINKKYQAHFEERKAKEAENEAKKTAICERVEAVDYSDVKTYANWDELTKIFMDAQAEWKTLGFASRKSNNVLYARFREACDAFFNAKGDFFKRMKESLAENLAKKNALCEQAEALKDSTDWRNTTDKMVALQAEWKTVGPVPKKQSDAVWQRFMAACDYFFDQKKQNTSGVRRAEQANLKLKQEIIDRLAAMTAPDAPVLPREEAQPLVNDLREQWNGIGHVPFRLKDKIYDTYRQLLRDAERKFDLRRERARAEAYDARISEMDGDKQKIFRERERLMRIAEQRRQELQTYENNLGFLSFKKGKGNEGLMGEMERRMQRIRDDIADLKSKIALLDEKMA